MDLQRFNGTEFLLNLENTIKLHIQWKMLNEKKRTENHINKT